MDAHQLLSEISISFASCSLGSSPSCTLIDKLTAIHQAGFQAIELSMPDLISHAKSLSSTIGHLSSDQDYPVLIRAAKDVKKLCNDRNLQIMLLQPFANFEGWPAKSNERRDAFERAKGWIEIMLACDCKTLQVGSTDTPAEKMNTDRDVIVKDLQELAAMLEEKGLKMAYENWCWSTHAPNWEDVWDIVKKVNRDNVGLCLDTFQTAGGEWGDPTTESGKIEGIDDLEDSFKKSMEKLSITIPKDKILLLQISDAYKPKSPFSKEPNKNGDRPRSLWSHDFRPLPGKGYLPVNDVAHAVLKTGFRGWFSYEVFDHPPWNEKADHDVDAFAKSAYKSHEELIQTCINDL